MPSGAINAWNKTMFNTIGNITTVARGTNLPSINARPIEDLKHFYHRKHILEAAIPVTKSVAPSLIFG
jgi:hypothetical protein